MGRRACFRLVYLNWTKLNATPSYRYEWKVLKLNNIKWKKQTIYQHRPVQASYCIQINGDLLQTLALPGVHLKGVIINHHFYVRWICPRSLALLSSVCALWQQSRAQLAPQFHVSYFILISSLQRRSLGHDGLCTESNPHFSLDCQITSYLFWDSSNFTRKYLAGNFFDPGGYYWFGEIPSKIMMPVKWELYGSA